MGQGRERDTMGDWHSGPVDALFQKLDASPQGLSTHQAAQRLERWGPNRLRPPKRPGLLTRILVQMKDPMILVLLGAAGLSLAASRGEDWLDHINFLTIGGKRIIVFQGVANRSSLIDNRLLILDCGFAHEYNYIFRTLWVRCWFFLNHDATNIGKMGNSTM